MSTLPDPDSAQDPNHEHSPERSATLQATDGIKRSVSFSDQVQERTPMETESSADEQTAIVRRQKGGKRNYDTARKSSLRPSTASLAAGAGSTAPQQIDEASDENGESPPHLSWWKRTLDKYGTIELQNKGSVARDHLALERTFLAWLRTSLSFASIGIAVTQLFRLDQTLAKDPDRHPHVEKLRHVGKPLGATFLGVGILVLLIGFHRYFESQHYVMLGKFPASRGSVAIVSFCAGALVVASLVVVLVIAPSILS